jgi:integrase
MSGVFERAEFWGLWKLKSPVKGLTLGRKQTVYKHEEWSIENTRQFLYELPYDVQTLCMTGLLTGLRISELLGLREKHLNEKRKAISVEERYYRGNIAQTKTENSERLIYLDESLWNRLKNLCLGDPERHIFHITTRPGWGKKEATCRNDGSIRRYFLRPAAEKLGLYRKGFGFHDLRREAATEYCNAIGESQTSKVMGHGSTLMTRRYEKQKAESFRKAMADFSDKLIGEAVSDSLQ